MNSQICIMIECDNDRKIFTNKKNLSYVIEFAKNFDLKLHYAKTDSRNIVSLEKLAKIYCDQTYISPEQFKIIKPNINCKKETRKVITDKAKQIRAKISSILIKKRKITFKQIQDKFEKENISVSALSNHFAHVRHELNSKGINVVKIKNGIYEVQAESKKAKS
jgi:hypothetical protein